MRELAEEIAIEGSSVKEFQFGDIRIRVLCNVCYISGFNPDRYTRCRPCEFDLLDLQGKKK